MVLTRPLVFAVALAACAPAVPARAPSLSLAGTDDASHAVWDARGPTVLVFYAGHCPSMRAHDARLAALAQEYRPRGVRFFLVDSEVHASVGRDAAQARERGYAFPVLIDHGARLARALGAEYATYTVVLDAHGRVLYHGGIDSDRAHLTAHPTEYLREALEDVTARKPVRRPEADVLGCALETW
jgi:peroxiredoxin